MASLTVAVLGAGNSGFGLVGDLGLKGHRVQLYEDPKFESAIEPVRRAGGIRVRGITGEGFARPTLITTDCGEALEGADAVLVSVPAYAHTAMAAACAPYLKPDQPVILMPGNAGGALEFRHELIRQGCSEEVAVAEASSFIFACKKDGPDGVWIRGLKQGLPVGVLPARKTAWAMGLFTQLYPELAAATDVLETSLSNVNHPTHPTAFLLNVARVEALGGDYSFFHEGMTPSTCRLTEVVDQERVQVVAALGYKPETTLEQLTRFYGHQGFGGATYYEAVHTTPVHGAARAPSSVNHRYFTEDIPFGLVPIVSIGETIGVKLPTNRGLVDVINAIMGENYWETGRTVEKLGLAGMSAAQMRRFAELGSR